MKKIFFQILSFLICTVCMGQEYIRLSDGAIVTDSKYETIPTRTIEDVDNGILVTYHFKYVSKMQDKIFPSSHVLFLDGFGLNNTSEEPALPMRWDTFTIPSRQDYSVSIVDSSYIELSMEIAPSRLPLINSVDEVYTKDNVKAIKPYKGFFPQNILSTKTRAYRNHPLLDICVYPIHYNYQQGKIRIYKKISYFIGFANSSTTNRSTIISTVENDPFLTNITLNPRTTRPNRTGSSATQITVPRYLIITVPKYNNAVNKLAEWKRTQGYDVDILSQTTWDENSVKSAVSNANPQNNLRYLLIVGDFEDVPGQAITDTINTTKGRQIYNFYTDYFYGFISQSDSCPSIRRGRIPVSTAAEAMTVINKTISYEKTPCITPSFYQTCLNCAYFQDDEYRDSLYNIITPIDSCEDRRFVLTSEEIRNHLLGQGKTVNRVYYAKTDRNPYYWNKGPYGFDSKVPIPEELQREHNFLWDGDSTHILNAINSGAFLVYHRDHGAINRWGEPLFGQPSIAMLNNGNKLPIVFSMNCLMGRYSGETCFAESFLRKENGGCAAIIAASETSFSGYNDALTLAMISAIWPNPRFIKDFPKYENYVEITNTPIYKLGDILDIGFENIAKIFPKKTPIVYLHTKEIFHCFGDPAMEIYTATPTSFENAIVSKNGTTLYVQPGEDAIVSFYKPSTGEVESFSGTNIEYPTSDDVRICISAHNKIPYLAEYANGILYIQNEIISTNRTYMGNYIKVGANVTSSEPVGEVRLEGGKTTIKGNTIELHGGTTVLQGAQLEINN